MHVSFRDVVVLGGVVEKVERPHVQVVATGDGDFLGLWRGSREPWYLWRPTNRTLAIARVAVATERTTTAGSVWRRLIIRGNPDDDLVSPLPKGTRPPRTDRVEVEEGFCPRGALRLRGGGTWRLVPQSFHCRRALGRADNDIPLVDPVQLLRNRGRDVEPEDAPDNRGKPVGYIHQGPAFCSLGR